MSDSDDVPLEPLKRNQKTKRKTKSQLVRKRKRKKLKQKISTKGSSKHSNRLGGLIRLLESKAKTIDAPPPLTPCKILHPDDLLGISGISSVDGKARVNFPSRTKSLAYKLVYCYYNWTPSDAKREHVESARAQLYLTKEGKSLHKDPDMSQLSQSWTWDECSVAEEQVMFKEVFNKEFRKNKSCISHSCDIAFCIAPDHLRMVTMAENVELRGCPGWVVYDGGMINACSHTPTCNRVTQGSDMVRLSRKDEEIAEVFACEQKQLRHFKATLSK